MDQLYDKQEKQGRLLIHICDLKDLVDFDCLGYLPPSDPYFRTVTEGTLPI